MPGSFASAAPRGAGLIVIDADNSCRCQLQAEQAALPIQINLAQDLKKVMDTDEMEQRWRTENVGHGDERAASYARAGAGLIVSMVTDTGRQGLITGEFGDKPLEFVEQLMHGLDPISMGQPEESRRRKAAHDQVSIGLLPWHPRP